MKGLRLLTGNVLFIWVKLNFDSPVKSVLKYFSNLLYQGDGDNIRVFHDSVTKDNRTGLLCRKKKKKKKKKKLQSTSHGMIFLLGVLFDMKIACSDSETICLFCLYFIKYLP